MTTDLYDLMYYVIIFLFGITIGSFLNVCIYRIPNKESIAGKRSHCMNCEYQLKWYDLVPIFSYLQLGGKCRQCKTRISKQYPLVELTNGLLYVMILLVSGFRVETLIYCLVTSALLTLSIIDLRTYEIPFGINQFILTMGLIHLFFHLDKWVEYGIGLVAVSGFLWLLVVLSKGRAMGGGDVKLMAAAGLLLGVKHSVLALVIGCILGSIIHTVRMKVSKEDHVLAFGPYLAAGIWMSRLWGELIWKWYLGLLF